MKSKIIFKYLKKLLNVLIFFQLKFLFTETKLFPHFLFLFCLFCQHLKVNLGAKPSF